jgi:hypothetical protein
MAPSTRFGVVKSTHLALLSLLIPFSSAVAVPNEQCSIVYETTYVTVTAPYESAPADAATAGSGKGGHASVSVPPNGPYSNPYDYTPLPYTWPGKPTAGEFSPPPRPTSPYSYGGDNDGKFIPPAWIPSDHPGDLTPGLPQSDTNGNSPWGICPPDDDDDSSSTLSFATSTRHGSSSTGKPGSPMSSGKPGSPMSSGKGDHSGSGLPHSSLPTGGPSKTISSLPHGISSWTSGISTYSHSTATSSSYSANLTSAACGSVPDTGVTRTYDFSVAYQTIAPDGVTKNGLVVNGGFPGPAIEANWGDWIQVTVTNNLPDEGTSLHWHGLLQKGTPWYSFGLGCVLF